MGEENGGVHLAWTATDSQTFARYVVARGPADTRQLAPIAELTDRQITSFTDPAAAHGVELLYEIVALGTDGRPVGVSDVVSVTLQDAPVSVPDEVPPTTDSSGGALGNPSTTQPDTTGPDTTGPDSSAPDTTGPDTSGPDTSWPGHERTGHERPGHERPGHKRAPIDGRASGLGSPTERTADRGSADFALGIDHQRTPHQPTERDPSHPSVETTVLASLGCNSKNSRRRLQPQRG